MICEETFTGATRCIAGLQNLKNTCTRKVEVLKNLTRKITAKEKDVNGIL